MPDSVTLADGAYKKAVTPKTSPIKNNISQSSREKKRPLLVPRKLSIFAPAPTQPHRGKSATWGKEKKFASFRAVTRYGIRSLATACSGGFNVQAWEEIRLGGGGISSSPKNEGVKRWLNATWVRFSRVRRDRTKGWVEALWGDEMFFMREGGNKRCTWILTSFLARTAACCWIFEWL